MSTTETASTAASDGRLEISLAPGITFPNWSAVSSETVRETLDAIFKAFNVEKCWRGMGRTENRVRRAILDHYGKTGHAPSLARLTEITALEADHLGALVKKLKGRDLLVLDESGAAITGAYPFTERHTGHRVRLGGVPLNAMCAIDALGAPAMYGKDALIQSACRQCGVEIGVSTRRNGEVLDEVSPGDAVVWSGIRYANDCAADSLCTVIAFFCSDAHLEAWRAANHPGIQGFRLSMDEAMQAGKAIFMPMLATASADDSSEKG